MYRPIGQEKNEIFKLVISITGLFTMEIVSRTNVASVGRAIKIT